MFLGIIVLITALVISAVAIYYSVAGLVAIFAATAVPIMIMGGALEIAKLVTAVWLHKYWNMTTWWLKTYLTASVFVLMLITSMGIFGFLSKAHIEQTAAAQEGVAQIDRIESELLRQQEVIARAEQRIEEAEVSVGQGNNAIQEQIDREQERIDSAYSRIQPAIDEQTAIIESARLADAKRTEPFEQQLTALDEELRRLDTQAQQIEQRISDLGTDTTAIEPVLAQIANIENSISLVQGQLAGGERAAIQSAQRTIGVEPDGSAGPNTRRAADAWIVTQQDRIGQLQAQIVDIRTQSQQTTDRERTRLTELVSSIRGEQTNAVKARQIEVLATIDGVRNTESPVIQNARDEISRVRAGADAQIAQSNSLIQSLRDSLTIGVDETVQTVILQQQQRIVEANNTIETLTEQKYTLQAEYRKLEAEVGPIKYIAEFVYGTDADKDLLEEAVRWVIILIIFVFDPLAVLLLIASQYTFEYHRKQTKSQSSAQPSTVSTKEKNHDTGIEQEVDTISAGVGASEEGRNVTSRVVMAREEVNDDLPIETLSIEPTAEQTEIKFNKIASEIAEKFVEKDTSVSTPVDREEEYKIKEQTGSFHDSKNKWKEDHPNETLKVYKAAYIDGKIDKLPWEGYRQNEEQNETSLFNKLRADDRKN